ncbi:YuzL family protein [Bacillus timonensis]|nr:YuzL family protein [Bacillus timonensis]
MAKHHKDPSKAGLSSPAVEGQGTTTNETGNLQKSSTRKKNKQN